MKNYKYRKISPSSEEQIRGFLISERSSGAEKSRETLAKELKKVLPDVDEDILLQVEQNPKYVRELRKRHLADAVSKEKPIWDALISLCKSGDVQAMKLYFQLTHAAEDTRDQNVDPQRIQEEKQIIKEMSEDELDKEMQTILKEMNLDELS